MPDVEWLGRLSEADKARRLRGATVACFPSIEGESFGIVLLEAMASGVPVVASDLTGYRHVARGGREAVLVEPGDPASLRAGLRKVLDEPGLRADLVAAGTRRAAEFSMTSLAEAFLERYEQARSGGPGASAARAPRSASTPLQ